MNKPYKSRGYNNYNNDYEKHDSGHKTDFTKDKVTKIIKEKKAYEIFVPGFDGPLLTFSLFNELQHNILPTEVVEEAYKDYKTKFENKRFQTFYIEHQHDEWFREKYEPELNMKLRNERNAQAQKLSESYLSQVNSNGFQNLKLELRESDENNKNLKIIYNSGKEEVFDDTMTNLKDDKNGDDFDVSDSPYYGFEPDKMTLFLHQLPKNVSRLSILEVLKKQDGFVAMSLSEPIKNQNYVRYVWVTYDKKESCEKAYDALNDLKISGDYKTNPILSKSNNIKKIRVCFPTFEDRIVEDLDYSKQLIKILDKEKQIEVFI